MIHCELSDLLLDLPGILQKLSEDFPVLLAEGKGRGDHGRFTIRELSDLFPDVLGTYCENFENLLVLLAEGKGRGGRLLILFEGFQSVHHSNSSP